MASIFESAVNMVRDDKRAYWYSNYPPEVRKMERFLKDYPDDVKIEKDYRNETGEAYGRKTALFPGQSGGGGDPGKGRAARGANSCGGLLHQRDPGE